MIDKQQKEVEFWHYEDFKYITNEEIVAHIQETDDSYYWDELDQRTQRLYSSVMRDSVHSYYKDNMRDDIMSILKIGWIKAVKTYNPNRATTDFLPYCSYLMEQNYFMFVRRIKKHKVGNSVRDIPVSFTVSNDENEKNLQYYIDIEKKCDDFDDIEANDYIISILNELKKHDELKYIIIKKHCLEGVTQKDLSKMLNMSQSAISIHMKRGRQFLKKEMELRKNSLCC